MSVRNDNEESEEERRYRKKQERKHRKDKYNPFHKKDKHRHHRHDDDRRFSNYRDGRSESGSEMTTTEEDEEEGTQNTIEFNRRQLSEEAPIDYDRVEYVLSDKFKPRELTSIKGNGELKSVVNNGKRICRVDAGLKRGPSSNNPDFKLSGRRHRNKNGQFANNKNKSASNRDIVKQIVIEDFMTNYKGPILIEVSVPRFVTESYYNDSENVNVVVMPNRLNANEGARIEVLKRSIKLEAVDFQNSFPGVTPENFDDLIVTTKSKTHKLVDFGHPLITYYNDSKKGRDKPITEDDLVAEMYSVSMPNEDVYKYGEIARDAMMRSISYADITHNFTVTISPLEFDNNEMGNWRDEKDESERDERRREDRERERRMRRERAREREMMQKAGFANLHSQTAYKMMSSDMKALDVEKASAETIWFMGRVLCDYKSTVKPVDINIETFTDDEQ